MLSEYESGVFFGNCPNVPPNVFSLMFHRMLPVCFPNVFSMVSEYFQNRANTSLMFFHKVSVPNAFFLLSQCFQNMTNRPRMERPFSASFTKIMCFMCVRGVRAVCNQERLIARSHCLSVCFPNRNEGVRGANESHSGSIRCVLESNWLFGVLPMHTERL